MNSFRSSIAVLLGVAAIGHAQEPLELKTGESVTEALVLGYLKGKPKTKTLIVNPEDLKFIVDSLRGLKSRMYDHSHPQFDLVIRTSNGREIRLRIGKHEIGPDAPASAWNRHWFPETPALFEFLVHKVYGEPGQ